MAASPKLTIAAAERRFPVRIRLGLPAGGFGTRWCGGAKVDAVNGVFRLRDDAPEPRVVAVASTP